MDRILNALTAEEEVREERERKERCPLKAKKPRGWGAEAQGKEALRLREI